MEHPWTEPIAYFNVDHRQGVRKPNQWTGGPVDLASKSRYIAMEGRNGAFAQKTVPVE